MAFRNVYTHCPTDVDNYSWYHLYKVNLRVKSVNVQCARIVPGLPGKHLVIDMLKVLQALSLKL